MHGELAYHGMQGCVSPEKLDDFLRVKRWSSHLAVLNDGLNLNLTFV